VTQILENPLPTHLLVRCYKSTRQFHSALVAQESDLNARYAAAQRRLFATCGVRSDAKPSVLIADIDRIATGLLVHYQRVLGTEVIFA
jgi:hypothetical protein